MKTPEGNKPRWLISSWRGHWWNYKRQRWVAYKLTCRMVQTVPHLKPMMVRLPHLSMFRVFHSRKRAIKYYRSNPTVTWPVFKAFEYGHYK